MLSQAIQVLSRSWLPVAAVTLTGDPHVVPPFVERLTSTAAPTRPEEVSFSASEIPSQAPCLAS